MELPKAAFVDAVTLQEIIPQDRGRPDSKLGAPFRIHPVADGDDGIKVAACSQKLFGRDAPGPVVLLPLGPAFLAGLKLFIFDGLGLGIVFPAFRQGVLIIQTFFVGPERSKKSRFVGMLV
jgi:hypothetical protein